MAACHHLDSVRCDNCRHLTYPQTTSVPVERQITFVQTGWECPACHTIYAPQVTMCRCKSWVENGGLR